MKDITFKEFKEILKGLDDAGIITSYTNNDGSVNYGNILNALAIQCKKSAEEEQKLGCFGISKNEQNAHDFIFSALLARDYYENVLK